MYNSGAKGLIKTHFNIIFTSTSRFFQLVSFLHDSPPKTPCISTPYMPHVPSIPSYCYGQSTARQNFTVTID